jgi:FtsH-binding integral membrane protein
MNKSENLKFILERYDHYIESVQSKSNLYIALNSLIVTGSIAILTTTDSQKFNSTLLALLIIIVLASIVSIIITLIALIPHLKTSQTKSVLFFNDVSSEKENDYCEKMNKISNEKFDKDIAKQI